MTGWNATSFPLNEIGKLSQWSSFEDKKILILAQFFVMEFEVKIPVHVKTGLKSLIFE